MSPSHGTSRNDARTSVRAPIMLPIVDIYGFPIDKIVDLIQQKIFDSITANIITRIAGIELRYTGLHILKICGPAITIIAAPAPDTKIIILLIFRNIFL